MMRVEVTTRETYGIRVFGLQLRRVCRTIVYDGLPEPVTEETSEIVDAHGTVVFIGITDAEAVGYLETIVEALQAVMVEKRFTGSIPVVKSKSRVIETQPSSHINDRRDEAFAWETEEIDISVNDRSWKKISVLWLTVNGIRLSATDGSQVRIEWVTALYNSSRLSEAPNAVPGNGLKV